MIKYAAKIICIGKITNLYLARIKKTENTIKLENRYSTKHLFLNLFVL